MNRRGVSGLAALAAVGLGLLPLLAVVLASVVADIRLSDATRDAIDVTGASIYVGALSNLGVVLWVVTAACCLFAAAILRSSNSSSTDIRFLAATGLVTAIAAVDDLFLLHERVLTQFLGVPDATYVVLWLGIGIAYLVVAGGSLRRHASPAMIAAISLFAVSVSIDIFAPFTDQWTFIEDSAKYLGIVLWMLFAVPLSFRIVLGASPSGGERTLGGKPKPLGN